MFRIVLIISAAFLSAFKCCDVWEDKIYGVEMGFDWNYLVNVTELGRAAYIGNTKEINISLIGKFFTGMTSKNTSQNFFSTFHMVGS